MQDKIVELRRKIKDIEAVLAHLVVLAAPPPLTRPLGVHRRMKSCSSG